MKNRSDNIKKGIERAPHRSLLKATGLTNKDMEKPLIAIANSWTETVPGHIHLRDVANSVKDGIRTSGGVPLEFNTIAICDGIAMAHKGMCYSLPSREVIADSIELEINAHNFDAMVCICSCDKIVPGMLMATCRLDIPTIFVTGGPMLPGWFEGKQIGFSNIYESISAVKNRISILDNWYEKIRTQRNLGVESLNPRFVLLHTFAHILINQLSNDCGYGSSALRERIYCDSNDEIENMNGILIYTASGDSEGSLGGLVRQGKPGRIENEIILALENTKWCSSDPVCIQSLGQGPDSCNLAACHNCVLLPETSCERGNRLLDRGLLIGTFDNKEIGFFNDF